MGIEDPDVDAAEQHRAVAPTEEDDRPAVDPGDLPLEADPADVAEQRAVIPDDDEWR